MTGPKPPHLRGEVKGLPLTPRERQVLRAMHRLRDRAAVALLLGISPSTVKQHLYSINRKLDAPPFTRQWT